MSAAAPVTPTATMEIGNTICIGILECYSQSYCGSIDTEKNGDLLNLAFSYSFHSLSLYTTNKQSLNVNYFYTLRRLLRRSRILLTLQRLFFLCCRFFLLWKQKIELALHHLNCIFIIQAAPFSTKNVLFYDICDSDYTLFT